MPPLRDAVGFDPVPLPCGIALMFGAIVAPAAELALMLTVIVLLLAAFGVVVG